MTRYVLFVVSSPLCSMLCVFQRCTFLDLALRCCMRLHCLFGMQHVGQDGIFSYVELLMLYLCAFALCQLVVCLHSSCSLYRVPPRCSTLLMPMLHSLLIKYLEFGIHGWLLNLEKLRQFWMGKLKGYLLIARSNRRSLGDKWSHCWVINVDALSEGKKLWGIPKSFVMFILLFRLWTVFTCWSAFCSIQLV